MKRDFISSSNLVLHSSMEPKIVSSHRAIAGKCDCNLSNGGKDNYRDVAEVKE